MKKVVHIIIGLNVGGAELMLKRLVLNSSNLENFQHEVISLTDLGLIGPDLKSAGIKVHTLGMTSLLSLPKIYLKLVILLKRIQPDAVQTWMYHSDFIGGLAARSLGIKNIIWGIRNTALDSNSGLIKKIIRKSCALLSNFIPKTIVCVADKAKELHVNIGYAKEKMIVIPNGFDTERFNFNDIIRLEQRKLLGIPSEKLVIGNIGRFVPAKNQLNFIEACIYLLNKGYDFEIVMAGRDVNSKNEKIKKLVENSKNFTFLGEIDEPEKFYNLIDIFCLSSITEGFPNVLGEAMSSEKVCLSTDAGDAKKILGNVGYHILSPSKKDIANCIETNILNQSYSDIRYLGKNARLEIINKYSIQKIVQDFEKLY